MSRQDLADYFAARLLLAQGHALQAAASARSEAEQELARAVAEMAGAWKALAPLVREQRGRRKKIDPGEPPESVV